jgi:hypothetical protein
MYFEVYVVATELRRKILATAPYFSVFFLDCRERKEIATETTTKGA